MGPEKSIRKNVRDLAGWLRKHKIPVTASEKPAGQTLDLWATELVVAMEWFDDRPILRPFTISTAETAAEWLKDWVEGLIMEKHYSAEFDRPKNYASRRGIQPASTRKENPRFCRNPTKKATRRNGQLMVATGLEQKREMRGNVGWTWLMVRRVVQSGAKTNASSGRTDKGRNSICDFECWVVW